MLLEFPGDEDVLVCDECLSAFNACIVRHLKIGGKECPVCSQFHSKEAVRKILEDQMGAERVDYQRAILGENA